MARARKISTAAGPFAVVPLWIADRLDRANRAHGVAVYVALYRYADAATGEAWPSQERIAADAGIGRTRLNAVLDELERIGALERRRHGFHAPPGRWSSTRYVVRLEPPLDPPPDAP